MISGMEMTDLADRTVLVDTSVWIDYFRKNETSYQRLNELMDAGRVCCQNLIVAELIQGAKSEKEIEVIRDFFDLFHFLKEKADTWFKAAYLSFQLRKKGKTAGLADCYIAQMAFENNAVLLSFDQHFKEITKIIPVELM